MVWVFAAACTSMLANGRKTDDIDPDIDTLARWMDGSFSSQRQSQYDTAYADLRLDVHRIWPSRTDGVWLVVEQSMATSTDIPLRQRVYHIHRVEENMIEIRVYSWNSPERAKGIWRDQERLSSFTTKDLKSLRGCEIYLQRDDVSFFGSTHGMACASDVKGASYSTLDVKIGSNITSLWDRVFTTNGTQVYGPMKGPYYFLRQNP